MTIPGILAGASVGNRWWEGGTRSDRDAGPGLGTRDSGTRDAGPGTRDSGLIRPDDPPRSVPRHVHHRGGRRGGGDHRSARRPRARAVRAGDGAADERAPGEPAAADADSRGALGRRSVRRCCSTPPRSRSSAWRSRSSAASASGCRPCRRSSTRPKARRRFARLRRTSKASIAARGVEDALRRIAATMACHAAVKANYPLTMREDAVHPRRAPSHRLFERLPARPSGRLASVTAGDREEFSANLSPSVHIFLT